MKNVVLSVLTFAALSFLAAVPAFAGFVEGKDAYDRKDWKAAIENLRPAAEAGDSNAMVLLANMYGDGLGVSKDQNEAFTLYHRAAVLNNASAMLAVGGMYQQGLGVPANGRLAHEWFGRSALLGHQTGAFFYGVSLYQGVKGKSFDLPAKHAEAYKWFRIAARVGKPTGMQRAAAHLADGIAKKLTPDELAETSKRIADWKPALPVELGPLPEEVLTKELEGKTARPEEKKPEAPAVNPLGEEAAEPKAEESMPPAAAP